MLNLTKLINYVLGNKENIEQRTIQEYNQIRKLSATYEKKEPINMSQKDLFTLIQLKQRQESISELIFDSTNPNNPLLNDLLKNAYEIKLLEEKASRLEKNKLIFG